MQINLQQNTYTPKFGMKFTDSEALRNIAEYAIEHGKFTELNNARKEIDKLYLRHKLRIDTSTNDKNMPVITFTKYTPKSHIMFPEYENDYVIKTIEFTSKKEMNVFDYAIKMICKMAQNKCKNDVFYQIIRK